MQEHRDRFVVAGELPVLGVGPHKTVLFVEADSWRFCIDHKTHAAEPVGHSECQFKAEFQQIEADTFPLLPAVDTESRKPEHRDRITGQSLRIS